MKRSSISDSLASSGQASPLIAMEWWVGKENLHVRRVVAKEASAGFRFKLPKFPSAVALLVFPSPEGVNAAREALRSRSPYAVSRIQSITANKE